MRLWSLHPRYLDSIGLVACWREALLAQKVLLGGTKGYRSHPQLIRFKETPDALKAIGAYLTTLWDEAQSQGYVFDKSKILVQEDCPKIHLTEGQLQYEFEHLLAKVKERSPRKYEELRILQCIDPNPIFILGKGAVAEWEKITINP